MAKKFIWDLPIRVFHWVLAILLCGSWYTVEVTGDMDTHMLIGQTILVLGIFRIVWGFIGTRYARFGSFLYKPAAIVAYAKSLAGRGGAAYAGHNPLGGLVVLLMLALVLLQASTGLFATDGDFYSGPLNHLISGRAGNQVTDFHAANFNVLLSVVIVHVIAVALYLLVKRENLVAPMFTGSKDDPSSSFTPIDGSKLLAAGTVLLLAAAVVYAVVTLL